MTNKSATPSDTLPYLGPLVDLPQYVKEKNIHHEYLALPTKAYEKTEWLVRGLADMTASVFVVPDVFLLDQAMALRPGWTTHQGVQVFKP